MTNAKSTAQVAGRPIHPMLIPFPVACFVLTFVAAVTMAYAKTLARVVKRMDGLGSAPYQFRFFM